MESRFKDFWAPLVVALAFFGLIAVFAVKLVSFSAAVVGWAQRDLESRTELAARTLAEPLKTQDFRVIHEFARDCQREGLELMIQSQNGGLIFLSCNARDTARHYSATRDAGDYRVSLFVPAEVVREPIQRAIPALVIAALLGIVGMFFVFSVSYRQHVRIRELQRVEKFRREFIADVSHEIKTPLTGILGAVDLMDSASPFVTMIRKEAKRLNALVQSILDLARLEREGEALNRTETDLAELVREVASRYPACRVEAEGSCVRKVDAQLMDQAIGNLIGNAVRHSGSDDIVARLKAKDDAVDIEVEDHGVGIPSEETERVFDRFHRVDPARAAETGGAGLGLAIVRRIARLHGGDVTLRAARPHGCLFTIHLKA